MGFHQGGHQRLCGGEQHGVVLPDYLSTERDRKVRFTHAWRSQEQHRFAVGDPAGGGELPDLQRIDTWLGVKVEPVELPGMREVSDPHRHFHPALVLSRDLSLAQEGQRFAHGEV